MPFGYAPMNLLWTLLVPFGYAPMNLLWTLLVLPWLCSYDTPVEFANVVSIILLLLTCRLFSGCYVHALMIFLENLLVLFRLFSYY